MIDGLPNRPLDSYPKDIEHVVFNFPLFVRITALLCSSNAQQQFDPCARAQLGPAMVSHEKTEKLEDTPSHGSPVMNSEPFRPFGLPLLFWRICGAVSLSMFISMFFSRCLCAHPSGDVFAVVVLSLLALPVIPLNLVGGLEHFLFSHLLGIIIQIDFHIFQRGRSTTNQELFPGASGLGTSVFGLGFPLNLGWLRCAAVISFFLVTVVHHLGISCWKKRVAVDTYPLVDDYYHKNIWIHEYLYMPIYAQCHFPWKAVGLPERM